MDTRYEEALERARAGVPIDEVFPELKESEDERIRKNCIHFLGLQKAHHADTSEIDECISYLEKQKEQKPIPKFKVGDRIYDKRDSYNRNVIREVGKDSYINAFAQKMDMAYTDANFEFLEHLDNDLIDSKPAEWSEEDENIYSKALDAIYYKDLNDKYEVVDSLESLCDLISRKRKVIPPYARWKPSEEQINALKVVARGYPSDAPDAIESLLNDLQKLL